MSSDRTSFRATLLAFAGLGITASLIPATLPLLSSAIGVPTSDLVPALPALFGGLLVGVLLAPVLAARRPVVAVVRLGVLVQAAGFGVLGFAGHPLLGMLGALICGIGFGLTESSGAVTARSAVVGATGRNLTGLTIAVAAAGATAPLLVVVVGSPATVRIVLFAAAAFHLATLLLLTRSAAGIPAPAEPTIAERALARPALARAALTRPAVTGLALTAAALFCFVGVEALLSGWSAVLVEREIGTGPAVAAIGTSAFWTLAGIGRVTAWLLTPRVLSNRQLTGGCAVLLVTSLAGGLLLIDTSPALALALLGGTVLASGPCYGLLLGDAVERASERSAPAVSAALVAIGAIGGTLLPLAAAFSPEAFGGRSSLVVASLGAVVLAGLVLALGRHARVPVAEGAPG